MTDLYQIKITSSLPLPQNQKLKTRRDRGAVYTSKAWKDSMQLFRQELQKQMRTSPMPDTQTLEGTWAVSVVQNTRADADAYLKFILDAPEGYLYLNDSQVKVLSVVRTAQEKELKKGHCKITYTSLGKAE